MFWTRGRPLIVHYDPPPMTEAEREELVAALEEHRRNPPPFALTPQPTWARVPSVPERLLYLVAVPAAVSAATSALLIWWFGA